MLGYPLLGLAEAEQERIYNEYFEKALRCDSSQGGACLMPICSDKDDQKFLELTRCSAADWLITRDKALLRLHRHLRIKPYFQILTPEQFVGGYLKRLESEIDVVE